MEIRPILSSLRLHKVAALLIVLEIAFTCSIVCNALFIATQRIQLLGMKSGVIENELVEIKVIGRATHVNGNGALIRTDLAALRQIRGVVSAAVVTQVPFGGSSWDSSISLDPGQRQATLNATIYSGKNLSQVLGLHLLRGRDFNLNEYVGLTSVLDGKAAWPGVAIITRGLAHRLWPDGKALGKIIYVHSDQEMRIVGVIDSLVRPSFSSEQGTAQWSVLLPLTVDTANAAYMLRTSPDQRQRVIKDAVTRLKVNDSRRIVKGTSFEDVRAEFFRSDRAMVSVLTGVAMMLLLITMLGIVGLSSFWVSQRRKYIGVRRALGATRGDILCYFQTENFLLTTFGIVLGVILAWGMNLFLMQHYEIPRLPWTYMPISAVVLWLLGQSAVLGPALRAANVSPALATRSG